MEALWPAVNRSNFSTNKTVFKCGLKETPAKFIKDIVMVITHHARQSKVTNHLSCFLTCVHTLDSWVAQIAHAMYVVYAWQHVEATARPFSTFFLAIISYPTSKFNPASQWATPATPAGTFYLLKLLESERRPPSSLFSSRKRRPYLFFFGLCQGRLRLSATPPVVLSKS